MKFYVLPGKVPCLIGMQALMKLGVTINLSIPVVKMNGRKLEVRETEAGHLVWRLEMLKTDDRQEMVYQTKDQKAAEWDITKIRKLHQRFGHTSKKKLTQLLESASKNGITKETKRLIEKVSEICEQCHNNKKQDRKSERVTYRSSNFNECVSIDLTEWFDRKEERKGIICHMIDEFSRLSAVTFIADKKTHQCVESNSGSMAE